MPRMACMATGRPIIFSWRRPAQSVQGWSSVDLLLEGGVRQLGGDAADRRGGDAAARRRPPRARSRRRDSARRAAGRPAIARAAVRQRELRRPARARCPAPAPSARVRSSGPRRAGGPRRRGRTGRHRRAPGSRITSQARWCSGRGKSRSMLPARSSSWHRARRRTARRCRAGCRSIRRRSRSSRCGTGLTETNLAPRALQLAEADLDRVGIVVLGDAEHHEVSWCGPSRARRTPRTSRRSCRARRPPC